MQFAMAPRTVLAFAVFLISSFAFSAGSSRLFESA